MSKLERIIRKRLLVCCFIACWTASPLYAQANLSSSAPPLGANLSSIDSQLLQAILAELRWLRAELHRQNNLRYRAQSLSERILRQQARVETILQELNRAKATTNQQTLDVQRDHEELKELEISIQETADVQRRATLVQSYNSIKRALERQRELIKQAAEQARERQTQLENTLRLEQAKLSELQDQFNAVDQEIEKPFVAEPKTKPVR